MNSTNWRNMPFPNKFYAIEDDKMITADSKHFLLDNFDENDIHSFPQDYVRDDYCVRNNTLVANPNATYDENIMDKQIAMWRAWDALGESQYMQEQYRGKSDINPETGNTYYEDYTAEVTANSAVATTKENDFNTYMSGLNCYTVSYETPLSNSDLPNIYNDDVWTAVPLNQWKYPHITDDVRFMVEDADGSDLTWKVFALGEHEVAQDDLTYMTSDFRWYTSDTNYEANVFLGWKIYEEDITFDVSSLSSTTDLRVAINTYTTVASFSGTTTEYTCSVGQLGVYVYDTGNSQKYQISAITDATTGNTCLKRMDGGISVGVYGSEYASFKLTSTAPVIKIEQVTATGAKKRNGMPKITWTFDNDVSSKSLNIEGLKGSISADGSIANIASGSVVRISTNSSQVFYDSTIEEMNNKSNYLVLGLTDDLTFKIKNKPSS